MKNQKETEKERIIDKLNIKKINDSISIGSKILKIIYTLIIFIIIYLAGRILKDWKVFGFIFDVLKVISPLFIGFVIAWLLNPIVTKFSKKGMSRSVSVILVYVVMLIIIYLIFLILIPSMAGQVSDIVASIPSILTEVKDWINNIFDKIGDVALLNIDDIKAEFFDGIESFAKGIQTNLPTLAVNIVKSLASGIGTLLLSFIVGFYMLFNFDSLSSNFLKLFPKNVREDAIGLLKNISGTLLEYVKGTLVITVVLFAVTFIGFSIIGLDAALLIAFFCALTNLIPYIGPYIGAAVAALVGFSQSTTVGILILIFILITQTLEGNFLQPMVMSKKMNLHPITILISLLIFGHFFGIIGMIIATPIVALIKIVFVYFNKKYNFISYDYDQIKVTRKEKSKSKKVK